MKKIMWNKFDRGVFLVNVLGLIYDTISGKIIIGKREKDPYIKQLEWSFPGGRPAYKDDLENYLKQETKKKTNLEIEIEKIIFAKTYPEDRRFLSIYYLAKTLNKEEAKAGEKFTEIKWINPTAVMKYFTTSVHPQLLKFLKELKKK